MAQSQGGTPNLGQVVLPNNFDFNFNQQLKRNSYYEEITYDKRPLMIPKKAPYQQADKDLRANSILYHTNDEILKKIPYEENKSRRLLDYYNGRNLNVLNSLKANSKRDYPDVSFKGQESLGRIK